MIDNRISISRGSPVYQMVNAPTQSIRTFFINMVLCNAEKCYDPLRKKSKNTPVCFWEDFKYLISM